MSHKVPDGLDAIGMPRAKGLLNENVGQSAKIAANIASAQWGLSMGKKLRLEQRAKTHI